MFNNFCSLTRFMIALIFFIAFTSCLPTKTLAAPTPPDAGTILQGMEKSEPRPPTEMPPDITVAAPEAATPSPEGQKFMVNGFRLTGETIVSEKELLQLISDGAGRELSLNDLYYMAGRITQYLRKAGYIVATAYIPAQHIQDGIVEIVVIPGKYGEKKLNNTTGIADKHFQALLAPLKPGMVITKESLERTLLLMNDLAGVRAKATLMPGRLVGTTDLVIDLSNGSKFNGAVTTDNWGGRYTGPNRLGVQFGLNNPARLGDRLTLTGLSSFDGLANGSLDYGMPLGGGGLRLDLNYSHVDYELGESFAILDAYGTADVYSFDLNYPFIRSRAFNLYGMIGFDGKKLEDLVGSAAMNTDRTINLWKIGISGNSADPWRGGGATSFSATIYGGHLNINDSSVKTAGDFYKMEFNIGRRQVLARNFQLDLMFDGQLASKSLDSAEQFSLGGADGLRAYPQGEAAGDQGFRLKTELQWANPKWSTDKNSLTVAFFTEYAHVTWDDSDNTRNLFDAGLGVLWSSARGFNLRCDYAYKLDSEDTGSGDDGNSRFWIRGVKCF